MLSKEDKQFLLSLARESVETYFRDESPEISDDKIEKFSKKLGLFVTLHKGDDWGLRGCIGFIQSPYPLYEGIIKAARLAAFEDQRFSPLEEDELEDIEFEISVLTEPTLIEVKHPDEYLKKIEVGKDGLIIKNRMTSGLLLPQVAPEWDWDSKEFLEHTCQKAGMRKDAYKNLENKVYKFQAIVFNETEFNSE